VDIPLESSEINAEIEKYQGLGRAVEGEVITFRATKSDDVAPWTTVAPELGWTGRARRLSCYDIPSSHLGIVRGPHAKAIAEIVSAARRRAEGGGD